MFRKIEDFVQMWLQEAESTVNVWKRIPETLKAKRIHQDVRSLERLAWHITQSSLEMFAMGGLVLPDQLQDAQTPSTMSEIIEAYNTSVKQVVDALTKQWSDDQLEDEVEMYGERWSKGKLLYIVLGHQGHHRSQMTVVMRALGLEVPGTWGPSKEEWAQFGMEAQA